MRYIKNIKNFISESLEIKKDVNKPYTVLTPNDIELIEDIFFQIELNGELHIYGSTDAYDIIGVNVSQLDYPSDKLLKSEINKAIDKCKKFLKNIYIETLQELFKHDDRVIFIYKVYNSDRQNESMNNKDFMQDGFEKSFNGNVDLDTFSSMFEINLGSKYDYKFVPFQDGDFSLVINISDSDFYKNQKEIDQLVNISLNRIEKSFGVKYQIISNTHHDTTGYIIIFKLIKK